MGNAPLSVGCGIPRIERGHNDRSSTRDRKHLSLDVGPLIWRAGRTARRCQARPEPQTATTSSTRPRRTWLQNSVHEAVGECSRLFLEVGLQVRCRHLQPHGALLWLAVLYVSKPRHPGLDLSAGRHEVRLVSEPPAVLLSELSLLPEVDAVVAAGDRHHCEGFAVKDRSRGR